MVSKVGPPVNHDFSIFLLELSALKVFVKNKALYLNLHRLFCKEWNVFICSHIFYRYITENIFVRREYSIEKIFSMAVSKDGLLFRHLTADIASNMEYYYLPFCSKYCD